MSEPGADNERLLEWVEQVTMFCTAEYGVPPIAGRILGWLMICDPAEQSAEQICGVIGASRASLATNMRVLTDAGFIRRRSRPGERTNYYRMDDDAWETVVRRRVASLAAFRDVIATGIDLSGTGSARSRRLRAAHNVYDWMAKRLTDEPLPFGKDGKR
ncbi:transcriptional regulator [Nocardia sp. MDA0666]|uniref:GbsR/MarR family transcriptional regulator n=1 Tax=Nocardia sp. MDA0666 TaxID=2135448 RepID=UPI000D11F7AB|nr:helix-turn-helix domain-containing protein [Nocardia sp. MDA0666]PSR67008.1 transcriptional regulator [Nocardia sp. MDA0666]